MLENIYFANCILQKFIGEMYTLKVFCGIYCEANTHKNRSTEVGYGMHNFNVYLFAFWLQSQTKTHRIQEGGSFFFFEDQVEGSWLPRKTTKDNRKNHPLYYILKRVKINFFFPSGYIPKLFFLWSKLNPLSWVVRINSIVFEKKYIMHHVSGVRMQCIVTEFCTNTHADSLDTDC